MDVDAVERLLTATEGRIKRAWAVALEHLRAENTLDAIAGRLAAGDPHMILAGLDRAAAAFAAGELGAYVAAGQATAKWLHGELTVHLHKGSRTAGRLDVRKKLVVFDPQEPGAVRWAEQNRLDKIREITADQRDMIRAALIDGARNGTNPREVARRIRDSIGLTDRQSAAVENYRRSLERGQYTAALQRELSSGLSDKTIAAALRNNVALTQQQIDLAVERYRANSLAMRAETIARTEGLRVSHQASNELYRQAIENGDLEASQIEQTWNHSPGAKRKKNERQFHVVMHGQKRAWGEKFVSGIGGELRFPGDPEADGEETICCRCCLSTRIRPASGSAASQGQGASPAAEEPTADAAALDEEAAAEDAAAEEEAVAAEEEAAAETAADPGADDPGADDLAADGDLAEFDAQGDPFASPPPGARHQQLQQAQQRLVRRQAEHAASRADLDAAAAAHEQATAELEAAQRELDGFRIGVASDIAGETEADEVDWLAEHRPRASAAAEPSPATLEDPYRTPGEAEPGTVLPSDRPAPVGYEAIEQDGQLYYRHQIDGRAYRPEQYAERQQPRYALELGGPNAQLAGYETLEIRTASMDVGELRYRSIASGATYTPEMIASGEAAAQEQYLADPPEAKKPGLLSRIFGLGRRA